MKPHDQERLAKRLASLDMNDRNRIYKRAAKLRKEEQRRLRKRPVRRKNWSEDDDGPSKARTRSGQRSLHTWALTILAQDEAEAQALGEAAYLTQPTPLELSRAEPSLVVHVERTHCEVLAEGKVERCDLAPHVRNVGVVVGDRVLIQRKQGRTLVRGVLGRRTELRRNDPARPGTERTLVANVDDVVIVVSLAQPPLRTGMVDRFLIAIRRSGARALICANKVDLCDDASLATELAKLEPYRSDDVEIYPVSAESGDGLHDLRYALTGRLSAFVGKSGVGKSSLMNALLPELELSTTAVRGDGKGRHTTTSSTLYELPGGGAIIDTPGIRSLGLATIEADELTRHFPELAEWSTHCRYRDCSHVKEASCGIRRAVQKGQLDAARWHAYLRVLAGR